MADYSTPGGKHDCVGGMTGHDAPVPVAQAEFAATLPLPANEAQRLVALRRYAVLDTPAESGFDDLTTLAAVIAGMPTALISLVDEHRQWFKSRHGFNAIETPREMAFCAHVVVCAQPLIVPDARCDPRFRDNPMVLEGPRIRFYAGFPLTTPDGYVLGTLCVVDYEPTQLSAVQYDALARLARQTMTQLELRRVGRDLDLAAGVAAAAGVEATRLAESRANFLSSASHEMLTPLNAVIGLSSLLLESGLPRDQHLLCRDIHDSGEHLQTLLSAMLDLASLEQGSVQLAHEAIDLRVEIGHVFDMLRPLATPKAVDLVLEPSTDVVCCRIGDAKRLRQIFGHLVDNAVKFTQGGMVRVRIAEVQMSDARPAVRVEVEDSGAGIAPALLAQIFEKFTQADDTSTRMHGGLGLGLAIARLLVRAMGGTLAVHSELGQGSTFIVTLPLDARPAARAASNGGSDRADGLYGLRVLVVDDNEVNRLLVLRLLRRLGCATLVACNGAEAVATATGDYDFVLMDCQMPVMDGFEATRAIREREMCTHGVRKPIVAVTASTTAHDRLRCSDHGMDDYLTKPLTGSALKAVMLKHLPPVPLAQAIGEAVAPAGAA